MKWTRISLVYLAGYLALTGAAFLLVPQTALRLLLATRAYDHVFVRFVGAFMVAVATLVVQIIRHRLAVLYPTTIAVRAFFLVVIAALYLDTRDRLFLVIFAVVAVGFAATATSQLVERQAGRAAAP